MKKHPQHRQLVNSNQAQAPIATFNRKAISLYVAMMFASNTAHANPTGGEFAAGAGAISAVGNLTTIQQASDRAIVNWQSFGSNAGETIKFIQPSADAAILNRVVGNLPSNLNGLLEGTGRVYLINPNGIVVGANGVINVNGGFVASTKSISDSAFMGGGALVFAGESTGSIQILGKVQSSQGDIILIAPKTEIMQSAVLEAGKSIKLVAANEVELSNGKITVKPKATDAGQITVEGALKAAQVQLEAHNNNLGALAINTTGTIRATGTQTNPDGSVTIMAYGEGSNIKVSGNISAQNNDASQQGGRIVVGRNEETGKLAKSADVSGARFVTNKGFVETSGHFLNVDGAQVIAKGWLLDPDNIEITDASAWTTGYSKISASTISAALNSTNVIINTTGSETGLPDNSTATGDGNILVSAAITKTGTSGLTKLTLNADNGITVNQKISSTGAALDVEMNANGLVGGKPVTGTGAMTAIERSRSAGVLINNTSIVANGGDVTLKGASYADNRTYISATQSGNPYLLTGNASATSAIGKGVQIHNGSSITAKNITITGTAENQANETSYGVVFQRYATAATLSATGDIKITGTLNGTGNGSGVSFSTSGWGAQAPMLTAGGNFTLRANNRASTSNTAAALYVLSGMQVKAVGDITVQAETNNAAANAMNFYSGGPGRALPTGGSEWDRYLQGNTSFQSVGSTGAASGNVLIQANQGSIVFNNNIPTNLTNGSLTALTDIKGKNITIDNTGTGMGTGVNNTVGTGGIDSATGAITAGSGKATGHGIHFADARNIAAAGNLNIMGASTGAVGINGAAVMNVTGDVKLNGSSSGTNANAHGIFLTGAVTSSNGAVSITGTSTHASGGGGATIQGAVNAKNNITLDGRSGNTSNVQGLVIQNDISSSDGDITVKGETKAGQPGQRAVALAQNGTVYGSLKVADGKTININANTLVINAGSSVDAGTTGTVNIKTLTSDNEILIGGGTANDVMSTSLGSQKLGIDNTELNRITAGNLVIGDTASTGKITVADATTLNQTGNITLQTGGDILVDKALTIYNNKTLTLKAGGTITDNDTTGVIKASKLELLGSNAAVTLDNKLHEVGTLAANVKSLNFANKTALTVGAVNTINSADQTTGTVGITAKDGISVTTQTGDLTIDKAIKNTDSGNVIVGAGVSEGAGLTALGNVKTKLGETITTQAGGKTLVYTGSASGTGLLSHLNDAFRDLKVTGVATGTDAQNTDTNFAYINGAGISVGGTASEATAQVMFREKVTITNGLVGTTVEKTYGDTSTANNAAAKADLLTETKAKLKQEVGNTGSAGVYDAATSGNIIKIAKRVIIDSLTGNLDGTDNTTYSTAGYLKANSDYAYNSNNNTLTSTKYTIDNTTFSGDVKITVAQKAITVTGSIASDKVYDQTNVASLSNSGTLTGGAANSADNKYYTNDEVGFTTTGATFADKNVARDSNGNVIAKTVTLNGLALAGNDAGNYSVTDASAASAKIKPKDASASADGKTVFYNGQLQTDTITKKGFFDGDNADIVGAGSGTAEGVYQSTLRVVGGDDASNYEVKLENAPFTIKVNTPSAYGYTSSPADAVVFSPVSFGLAYAGGATAAGGEVEGSCDAWSQRAGAGSISLMSVLKPSYMGLRNAKTDTMDAMAGTQALGAPTNAAENPCASAAQVERQAKL